MIANQIRTCVELRKQFVYKPIRETSEYALNETPIFHYPTSDDMKTTKHRYEIIDGVYRVYDENDFLLEGAPSRKEYSNALNALMTLASSGPVKSFCHNRLHILEARYKLHELLNQDIEQIAQKTVPHRDFYNVRKIDNHVHHSAVNQKN
jgi:AMP deaminase